MDVQTIILDGISHASSSGKTVAHAIPIEVCAFATPSYVSRKEKSDAEKTRLAAIKKQRASQAKLRAHMPSLETLPKGMLFAQPSLSRYANLDKATITRYNRTIETTLNNLDRFDPSTQLAAELCEYIHYNAIIGPTSANAELERIISSKTSETRLRWMEIAKTILDKSKPPPEPAAEPAERAPDIIRIDTRAPAAEGTAEVRGTDDSMSESSRSSGKRARESASDDEYGDEEDEECAAQRLPHVDTSCSGYVPSAHVGGQFSLSSKHDIIYAVQLSRLVVILQQYIKHDIDMQLVLHSAIETFKRIHRIPSADIKQWFPRLIKLGARNNTLVADADLVASHVIPISLLPDVLACLPRGIFKVNHTSMCASMFVAIGGWKKSLPRGDTVSSYLDSTCAYLARCITEHSLRRSNETHEATIRKLVAKNNMLTAMVLRMQNAVVYSSEEFSITKMNTPGRTRAAPPMGGMLNQQHSPQLVDDL